VIARHGSFTLDDDLLRVDRDAVWHYLSTQAYWGRWRNRDQVEQQIDGAWRVVGTRDAHGLYARFGFAAPDDSYVERRGANPATLP
jgi:hypothetical protein